MNEYRTIDVAIEHLELAISLFIERGPSFSVITLSGVAEELLGRFVIGNGKNAALESLVNLECEIHYIVCGIQLIERDIRDKNNRSRNKIKHTDAHKEPSISIELAAECENMLERALTNYTRAELHYTDIMLNYVDRGQTSKA